MDQEAMEDTGVEKLIVALVAFKILLLNIDICYFIFFRFSPPKCDTCITNPTSKKLFFILSGQLIHEYEGYRE